MKPTIEEKYRVALMTPPQRGNRHPQLAGVCALGVMAGASDAEIVSDVSVAWAYSQKERLEIEDTIRRQRKKFIPRHELLGQRQAERRPFRPEPQREKTFSIDESKKFILKLIQLGHDAREFADLIKPSPIDIPPENWKQSITFLKTIYKPDDRLFIGFKEEAKIASRIRPSSDWITSLGRVVYGVRPGHPPQIGANPLTGTPVQDVYGDTTYRVDDAIASFRFTRIEFDDMPLEIQIKFWLGAVRSRILPVRALVFSGKKSIHALLEISSGNRAEWDSYNRKLASLLANPELPKEIRADPSFLHPSHMMRFPGSKRANLYEREDGDGEGQPLLWLSPPTPRPIPLPRTPTPTPNAPRPQAPVIEQEESSPAPERKKTALQPIAEKGSNPYEGLILYRKGRWRIPELSDNEVDKLLDAVKQMNPKN